MKALDRKLLRDLSHMKGQALAIALVVAASIAVFVSSLATYHSLERTQAVYYERYRFAEVFAHAKRAPAPIAARVADIPGVAAVEARVAAEVVLDVPGLKEPAVGRLISIPLDRPPVLNAIHLRRGRLPAPGRSGEVLVSEAFADANQLEVGGELAAVVNGRWQRLTLVGVALSPEFIYQLRAGSLFPDDRRYGIFWMGRAELEAALDMKGAFNDLTLTLTRGASQADVITAVDRLLAPYGGVGAYGRDLQLSHRFIHDEIQQLRANAILIPGIFLAVAAFLLNIVLARTVGTQRGQIAVLKAFGYSDRQIGVHYLKFTLAIALIGTLLGALVGVWLGGAMTRLYTRFYRFPLLELQLRPGDIVLAMLVSSGAAAIGSLQAVLRVAHLPPAAALQPEPPPTYRRTLVERLGLARFVSPPGRMILRHLSRRPGRALMSIIAMSFAVAILVIGGSQEDAVRLLIDIQWSASQRDDVTVNFVEPRGPDALHALAHLPGVLYVEPFRAVPATLRFGQHSYDAAILGLEPDSDLHRLVDERWDVLDLPPEGLALTTQLARILHLGVGDRLTVEVKEGRRPRLEVPVVALLDEPVGVSAYMELGALHRLMEEGQLASGAYLAVDPLVEDALYAELKRTPGIIGVGVRQAAIDSFNEVFAENLRIFRSMLVIFAVIIAFGVVYNGARIALAERSRELASLRVLGLTRGEISFILLGEMAILTVLAIPLGCVLGYGLAAAIAHGYQTDLFRIPLVVRPASFGFAAVVLVVASAFSALVVRRRLDRLDLVEVLKTRE